MGSKKCKRSPVAESIKATTGLVEIVPKQDRLKAIQWIVGGCVIVAICILCIWVARAYVFRAPVVENNGPVQTQFIGVSNVNYIQTTIVRPDPNSPFYNAQRTGAFSAEKLAALPQMLEAMDAYTTRAEEALRCCNREALITCAGMAGAAAVKALDEVKRFDGPYSEEFKAKLARTSKIHFEATLTDCKYDEMCEFADRAIVAYGNDLPADVRARYSMAKMLKDGQDIVQPTCEELKELKRRGKLYAYEYLNHLARYGVLFPRKVDVFNPTPCICNYKSYFGFDHDLEFQPIYVFKTRDDDGKRLKGDELTQRYAGFGKKILVNLTQGYSKYAECSDGTDRELEYSVPCDLMDRLSPEELINTITVDVKADEAQLLNYDPMIARWLELCQVANDGHEILVSKQMLCVPVPEPVSGTLLALGCAVLALRRKR